MEDIRLKTVPFEYKGKTYKLCCNFNVLADLIDHYGKVPDVLGKISLSMYSTIIAFAMNEYADQQGWNERFTPREIGRSFDVKMLKNPEEQKRMTEIISLVVDAIYTKVEDGTKEKN